MGGAAPDDEPRLQRGLHGHLPPRDAVIASRTADWAARGEVDLYTESRQITFDIVADAGGAEPERRPTACATSTASVPRLRPTTGEPAGLRERLARVESDLRALLLPLIDSRRRHPRGPPHGRAGMLVQSRDRAGKGLSDDYLAHVNILLVAGHETSTTLAAWLLHSLAQHRCIWRGYAPSWSRSSRRAQTGVQEREVTLEALRRMRVLHNAMTEAGRLQSPVRQAPRGVLKAFDFAGHHVPAGTQVRYAIAAGTGSRGLPRP